MRLDPRRNLPALPLEGHESMDYLDYAPTPTTGHAAPDLAGGFSTIGRWLQLAAVAIEDLCVSAALPRPQDDPRFWHATVAYLVVPELALDRFRSEPYCTEDGLPGNFRDPLLMRVGHCFAPARLGLVPKGRHGVLEVLRSVSWRAAGVERFIVVATDSLVDVSSLRWLDESGRLKSDLNPVGLSSASVHPTSSTIRASAGAAWRPHSARRTTPSIIMHTTSSPWAPS